MYKAQKFQVKYNGPQRWRGKYGRVLTTQAQTHNPSDFRAEIDGTLVILNLQDVKLLA